MSDINIPGLSSKYNSSKLVEDLVAAEALRLTRLGEEKTRIEDDRSIWRQLNRQFGDLQRSAKSLYGFENPFSEKKATSSNERVLDALASRIAPFDDYSLTIKKIASSDHFISSPLERSFRVKAGTYTFSIGEQRVSLRYRGGSLDDFTRKLSKKGDGLIKAHSVRDSSETQVLIIEAIPTGASNRLLFEADARTLGIESGMLRQAQGTEQNISIETLTASALEKAGTSSTHNEWKITDNVLSLRPSSSLRLPIDPPSVLQEGMVLEYSYRTVEYTEEDLKPEAPLGANWPRVPSGRYQGIVVKSAPNSFEILSPRDSFKAPPRLDDWEVVGVESSSENYTLPPLVESNEFRRVQIGADALPAHLSAITLDNGNTWRGIEIKDIRLYNPNRTGDTEPVNPSSVAEDALIEFRGIDVRRSSNTINDLIDGVTLNLKKASNEPVEIQVEPDTSMAKESIIRFVYDYNQLLTRILVLTSNNSEIIDELSYLDDNQRKEFEEQLGSMSGEQSLLRSKNHLQTILSNPYKTRLGSELVLLTQMGISTNASSGRSGGSLDYSKLRGYLEIDEEKLDMILNDNIDAVKDIFGKDSSGDLVIDSGAAREMDRHLNAYTQTNGFMSIHMAQLDNQLKDKNEDIEDYETHLEDYETDLKRQYGQMEGLLNQLEQSSKELSNFNNQQSNN